MAFILQGDTPVDNANAYIDPTALRDYWLDRGIDLTARTDADLQVAIVKATAYLDVRFRYIGIRVDRTQDREWPRQFVVTDRGDYVSGMPNAVKFATAEYAYRALSADLLADPTRDSTDRVIKSTSTSVGPIKEETAYDTSLGILMPDYPAGDRYLIARGLVVGGETAFGSSGMMFGDIGRG